MFKKYKLKRLEFYFLFKYLPSLNNLFFRVNQQPQRKLIAVLNTALPISK